mgnify:CR=1 FL=1
MKGKVSIVVENSKNLTTGGDIVGLKLKEGLSRKEEVFTISISEKNYSFKFLGERIPNFFKTAQIITDLEKSKVCFFNYFFDFASLYFLFISFFSGNRNVIAFHTFFKKGIKLVDLIYSAKRFVLLNFAIVFSDKIIFLTNAQREGFRTYAILRKKFDNMTSVISNGIEKRWIINKKHNIHGINLIYIGRLVSQKGSKQILEISEDKNLFSQMVVVGSGNKNLERRFDNIEKVNYYKSIDNKKIFGLYDKSNIFLLPSYSEVFPIVILEAMARGLVILVSDIPGMREIVKEGRNGYLFPPGDIEKMKEIILYLKNNPKELERISKNNLKDIWKFTAEKQIPKYLKVYEEVLGNVKK